MYGKEKLFIGHSVNLNSGGLFLETWNPSPLSEHLNLRFQLPNQNQLILCQGRVAWVNSPDSPFDPNLPPGMGIKFVDLKQEHSLQIQAFLKNLPLASN